MSLNSPMNSSRNLWATLMGLFAIKFFISSAVMMDGLADCEASNPQNRFLPLI